MIYDLRIDTAFTSSPTLENFISLNYFFENLILNGLSIVTNTTLMNILLLCIATCAMYFSQHSGIFSNSIYKNVHGIH